jgi:hypothetical protein
MALGASPLAMSSKDQQAFSAAGSAPGGLGKQQFVTAITPNTSGTCEYLLAFHTRPSANAATAP